LEKEKPELADKAKKYLGYELYYNLSQNQGKPMTEASEGFADLIKKSDDLNEKFTQEMHHYHKSTGVTILSPKLTDTNPIA
jgi:hypothetical protein